MASNDPQNHSEKEKDLTLQDGIFLVKLAREAITNFLEKSIIIKPPSARDRLLRKAGVFVTLNSTSPHELRGCIGFPYPEEPLLVATIKAAIYAATEDPRFQPVSIREFENSITVDVTTLTPPRTLPTLERKNLPELVTVGRDGLIVERGGASGLLLPQVAVEWKWDAAEFLTNCCLKAGLTPDAWLLDGVTVKVFEGQVFEESEPGGEVTRKR